MIDLHCHILPHVDDGSPSTEETLKMAAMAVESGVTDLAATPHFQYSEKEADRILPALKQVMAIVKKELDKQGIPLVLHSGAEILCAPDTPELLKKGKLPMLADSDYLLVEFWFDSPLHEIDDMLQQIKAEGAIPVIAHPERYRALQRHPNRAADWFEKGYILQLNKGSILGALGRDSRKTAHWLLDRGLAHLVASDAHTASVRTPRMTELKENLEELWGGEYAEVLLQINPQRILHNRPVLSPEE